MAHARDHARAPLVAQALEGEGVGGRAHERVGLGLGVLDVVAAARPDHPGLAGCGEPGVPPGPLRALARQGALVQVVAQVELQSRAAHAALAVPAAQLELLRLALGLHALGEGGFAEDEPELVDPRELLLKLAVCEDSEVGGDD